MTQSHAFLIILAAKPPRLPRLRGWRCLPGSYFKAAFLSHRRKAAKLPGNGFPGQWKWAKKGGVRCCFPPFPPRFCSQGEQRTFGGPQALGFSPLHPHQEPCGVKIRQKAQHNGLELNPQPPQTLLHRKNVHIKHP